MNMQDSSMPPMSSLAPVPGGLSVAIITKNEAHRIEACLRSVAFADQIVVLDSGSTDGTVEIARRLGAEVEVTPDWPGFGPQKNRALARCTQRWVLSIDADEQLSEALAAEIVQVLRQHDAVAPGSVPPASSVPVSASTETPVQALPASSGSTASSASASDDGRATTASFTRGSATARDPSSAPAVAGYWLRRSSTFCGQVIRHGLWGNDRVLRLFERHRGRFSDDRVHERLICEGPTRVLDGVLLHDSVDSLDDARNKALQYAWLGAEKLRARRGGGLLKAFLHGAWSLLRGYLLRAGFLDGANGLRLAWLHAQGTYWKYRWAALPEGDWQAKARVISGI